MILKFILGIHRVYAYETNITFFTVKGNENDNKRIRELQNEIEKLQLQIKELQKELELCKAEKEEYINKLAKLEKEKQGKIKTMEIVSSNI